MTYTNAMHLSGTQQVKNRGNPIGDMGFAWSNELGGLCLFFLFVYRIFYTTKKVVVELLKLS